MIRLCDVVEVVSGTPQFRITEESGSTASTYAFYAQADLEEDLVGSHSADSTRKWIRTSDAVMTTSVGDVVFSLISGSSAIVGPGHEGCLLTQNYAKLVPSGEVEARYLVYLLNEDRGIRRQLRIGQQGSISKKYALGQLAALELPSLPSLERQALIGELYVGQLRLDSLRKRVSELETTLVLEAIREVSQS